MKKRRLPTRAKRETMDFTDPKLSEMSERLIAGITASLNSQRENFCREYIHLAHTHGFVEFPLESRPIEGGYENSQLVALVPKGSELTREEIVATCPHATISVHTWPT